MNREIASHPEPERLLLYADGALNAAARAEVSGHLANCSECQAWLDDLQSGVADYAQTWMPALREAAGPPPSPWLDLRARMAKVDAKPVPVAIVRPIRFRTRWTAIAAGVVLAFVVARWFTTERVSAAELLRKAADHEAAPPQRGRPIRITTQSGSLVRPAVWTPSGQSRLDAGSRQRAEALRRLFESANYSWDEPLSARAFSAWRESLPDRHDEVAKVRESDGGATYRIRTTTNSGTLAEARLSLRASDLHATQGTLRFRGSEIVEIAEMPAGSPEPPSEPNLVAELPRAAAPAAEIAVEPVTPGDELRVWAALRGVNADLGEPIEVDRDASANSIVVSALGLSPAYRRGLEDALSGLPRVQLRFREPQPVRPPSQSLTGEGANQAPPLQPKLESQLGSRQRAEEFTNRLLEASESSLLRAHAIRELAQHFPPEIESQLSAEERSILDALLADHLAGLDTAVRRILADGRYIVPAGSREPPASAQNWQSHAGTLVTANERVDRLLTQLLAVGGPASELPALTAELDGALSRLEATMLAAKVVLRRPR